MKPSKNRVLVLMRDVSTEDQPIFVADLYSGHRLEDSVYLDHDAILEWIMPIDPEARGHVAHALNQLMYSSGREMYSIPVCPAQA